MDPGKPGPRLLLVPGCQDQAAETPRSSRRHGPTRCKVFRSRFARIHVLKTGLPGSSGRNPLKIAQPHLVAKKSSDGRSARLRGSTLARKPRPVKSCPTSRQKPKERETVQTGANLNPEVVSSVECFCLDKKTTLANKSKFKKSHGGLSVRPPRTRRHAHRSPLSPLTPCPPPCT